MVACERGRALSWRILGEPCMGMAPRPVLDGGSVSASNCGTLAQPKDCQQVALSNHMWVQPPCETEPWHSQPACPRMALGAPRAGRRALLCSVKIRKPSFSKNKNALHINPGQLAVEASGERGEALSQDS